MDAVGMNPDPTFGSTAGSVAGQSTMSDGAAPESNASVNGNGNGANAIKRRSPIACRRCRRMRSKCIHDKGQPPCKSCVEAGIPMEECIFPVRGQPDSDRDYRHPRTRADKAAKQSVVKVRAVARTSAAPSSVDDWENLPPLGDLIDGVHRFTRYYFQLGFIAKQQFPDRLRRDHRSINLFLLMSILSISARLSPALRDRYGSGVKAAEHFMERASETAVGEVYQEPTLERCQAFYLLSIAQQGSGLKNKSYMNMGIAIRMAQLMQLHREETYQLSNPSPELIVRAESARRTLWMLHSQDSLHSGPLSPVSLAAADITALLPCNEEDFAHGREPRSRAALEGTQPAIDNPALISDPNRSLFATLMQIHNLWGIVGRRAVSYGRSPCPWDPTSEFSKMVTRLRDWEQGLPHEHIWSTFLLKGYKAEGQDLAYLCVTMMTRLCNIVLRRPYLIDIFKNDTNDPQKLVFFSAMSLELFRNVHDLYEQIDAQFTDRTPDESVGAQIAAFCVYSCGLFSTYLCKYPNICSDPYLARQGPVMLQRTLSILQECKQVWPLASRWVEALEGFTRDPKSATMAAEGSMADGKDPIPHALRQLPPLTHNGINAATGRHASTSKIPSVNSGRSVPRLTSSMSEPVLPRPGRQSELPPASLLHTSNHSSPKSAGMPSLPIQNGHAFPQPHHQANHHQQYQPLHPQLSTAQLTPPHLSQQPPLVHQQQQHHIHSQSLSPQDSHHQNTSPHMYMAQQQPQHSPPPSLSPPVAAGLARHPGGADGVGMLIEAFDNDRQPNFGMAAAGVPAFYAPLGPGNDGFDCELQFYIDGQTNNAWLQAEGWMEN